MFVRQMREHVMSQVTSLKEANLLSTNASLLCTFRTLSRRRHTGPVGTVLVSAHREYQESREALDPRDQ